MSNGQKSNISTAFKSVGEAVTKPIQDESKILIDETAQALGGYSGHVGLTPQQQEEKAKKEAEEKALVEKRKANIDQFLQAVIAQDKQTLERQNMAKKQLEQQELQNQEEKKKKQSEQAAKSPPISASKVATGPGVVLSPTQRAERGKKRN